MTWEVRVGSMRPQSNPDIDAMTLCVQDSDGSRPHTMVFHLMCKQIMSGRYIAIRHTDISDHLSLAEVMPWIITA
jgi:hypothetical protein